LLESTNEISFFAYIHKLISMKNPQTNDQELWKILALTHEQEIVCIEITERSYILSKTFPKEGSYVQFENLQYSQSI
jgi:hypothetical protein